MLSSEYVVHWEQALAEPLLSRIIHPDMIRVQHNCDVLSEELCFM